MRSRWTRRSNLTLERPDVTAGTLRSGNTALIRREQGALDIFTALRITCIDRRTDQWKDLADLTPQFVRVCRAAVVLQGTKPGVFVENIAGGHARDGAADGGLDQVVPV